MANQVDKFGLRPYRKLDGTPLVGAQNRYTISANNNQPLVSQFSNVVVITTVSKMVRN